MKKDNFIEPFIFETNDLPKYDPLSRVSISEDNGEIITHEYEPGFLEATPKSQEFIDETILKQHEDLNKKGEK